MATPGTIIEGFAWGLGALAALSAGAWVAQEYQQELLRNLVLLLAPVVLIGGATLAGMRRGGRTLLGWLIATMGLPFVWGIIYFVSLSRGLSGMANMH